MKHKYWALFLVEDGVILWDSLEHPNTSTGMFYGGPYTPVTAEALSWDGRKGYVLVKVEVDDDHL